jgi:hypothetical protein
MKNTQGNTPTLNSFHTSIRICLVLILIVPLPFACDFGTSSYPESRFNLESIGLNILSTDGIEVKVLNDTIEHESDNLVFSLFIEESKAVSFVRPKSFIWSNLYADPVLASIVTLIDLIDVKTKNDIVVNEVAFKSGESISELFYAFNYSDQSQSIPDFLSSDPTWYLGQSINLIFRDQLADTLETTLDIAVIMSDGAVFEVQTPALKLY